MESSERSSKPFKFKNRKVRVLTVLTYIISELKKMCFKITGEFLGVLP